MSDNKEKNKKLDKEKDIDINTDDSLADELLEIEFVSDVKYNDDLSNLSNIYAETPQAKSARRKKFKKSMIIYSIVLAVLVVAIWGVYYKYLKTYDVSTPASSIETVIKECVDNDFEGLYEDIKLSNEFEEEWMLSDYIKEITSTYEVIYKQIEGKDKYNAVYELSANETKFAKIYLSNLNADGNVTDEWKLTMFDASEYLPVTNSYTITVPYGSEVKVNGIKLDTTYIQTEQSEVKILVNVAENLKEMLYNTIYEIKGFYDVPAITVIDKDGDSLEVVEGSREFTAKYKEDEATKKEFEQYAKDIMKAYSRYYVKLSDNINNYIRSQTSAYDQIKNGARYEYPDGMLASAKFVESGVSEFIRYSSDCFTCRIKYTYAVEVVGKDEKEIFEKDMIWTFVKFKGLWYLTDINEYH